MLWFRNKESFIEHHHAWRARRARQGGLHEPVPRPRDRRAVHLRLKLVDAPPADYGHASCVQGIWHTKSPAPLQTAYGGICLPCSAGKGLRPVEVELHIRCTISPNTLYNFMYIIANNILINFEQFWSISNFDRIILCTILSNIADNFGWQYFMQCWTI